jgi:hypothetical protein
VLKSSLGLLVSTWLFVAVLIAIVPVRFGALSPETLILVIGSIALYAVGHSVVGVLRPVGQLVAQGRAAENLNRLKHIVLVLSALGTLSSVLFFFDLLVIQGISYDVDVTFARTQIRENLAERGSVATGGFVKQLALLFSGCPAVAALIAFVRPTQLSLSVRAFALSSVIFACFAHASTGTRNAIGIILLFLFSGVWLTGLAGFRQRAVSNNYGPSLNRSRTATALLLVCGFVGAILFSGSIFVQRHSISGQGALRAVEDFERVYLVEVDAPMVSILTDAPEAVATVATVAFYFAVYLTHGLFELDRLLLQVTPVGGPYFGRLNLHYFTALAFKLGFVSEQTVLYPFEAPERQGYYSTLFGTLYLDFGYFGALLVSFSAGAVAGWFWRRARYRQTLPSQLANAFMGAAALYSPFFSIIILGSGVGLMILLTIAATGFMARVDIVAARQQLRRGYRLHTEMPATQTARVQTSHALKHGTAD